jgi:hypothetical protein
MSLKINYLHSEIPAANCRLILHRSRKTAGGGTSSAAVTATAVGNATGSKGGHQFFGLFAAALFTFDWLGLRRKNQGFKFFSAIFTTILKNRHIYSSLQFTALESVYRFKFIGIN